MKFFSGILFTFLIAGIGYFLANFPFLNHLGSMILAILLAILYRQFFGYPEPIKSGIQFSSKKILRFAIILFGFKLNIDTVLHQGLGLLAKGILTILLAVSISYLIARLIKADKSLSFLLSVGTGICGAAAIAAVSPIIKANEEDTAIGVGVVALMGTVFTVFYSILYPILHLTPIQYGIWSGLSLHEIAHVAAAASPAGNDALAIALLAKLGRVLLLVPFCFILVAILRRKKKDNDNVKVDFPWFLLGFIETALIGTYVHIPKEVLSFLSTSSSFLLTAAMVGLGLNVHFKVLLQKSLKPIFAMFVASVVISIVSFLML